MRFKNYRPAEVLSYLSTVKRTDAHNIRFEGKDAVEVSKFLQFLTHYEPGLTRIKTRHAYLWIHTFFGTGEHGSISAFDIR